MPSQVYFENVLLPNVESAVQLSDLKNVVSQRYGVSVMDLFVTINGKTPSSDYKLATCDNVVRIYTKLIGGKGGFGSMLRAIGAQIEKTTNREACRDLSGRRLRDINEEKRLRKWLEGQEDRDKEAAERKQKKLERLMAEPKIEVDLGKEYFEEREALPDRVSAAVEAGWQAAGSSSGAGIKRKAEEVKTKKKKSKLWIDADLSECSSSSEDEADELPNSDQNVSTDSGNESSKVSKANSDA